MDFVDPPVVGMTAPDVPEVVALPELSFPFVVAELLEVVGVVAVVEDLEVVDPAVVVAVVEARSVWSCFLLQKLQRYNK